MEASGVDNDLVDRVYTTAKGYGEALATHHSSVQQVLAVAGHDRRVLEAARERAHAEGEGAARQPTTGVSDVVDEASALVASRLLDEAIAELDRKPS